MHSFMLNIFTLDRYARVEYRWRQEIEGDEPNEQLKLYAVTAHAH